MLDGILNSGAIYTPKTPIIGTVSGFRNEMVGEVGRREEDQSPVADEGDAADGEVELRM